MKDFIDQNRDSYGVEPICKVLQIDTPYYRRDAARQRNPLMCCARAQRGVLLVTHIQRVWPANMQVI